MYWTSQHGEGLSFRSEPKEYTTIPSNSCPSRIITPGAHCACFLSIFCFCVCTFVCIYPVFVCAVNSQTRLQVFRCVSSFCSCGVLFEFVPSSVHFAVRLCGDGPHLAGAPLSVHGSVPFPSLSFKAQSIIPSFASLLHSCTIPYIHTYIHRSRQQ